MRLTIPIEPVGQMRARHSVRGGIARTHKAPQQKSAENKLLAFAVENRPKVPIDVPIEVKIDAYMAIPKSASKKYRALAMAGTIRPTKKPDADNIAKHLLDCFNEIFWTDDKIIVELRIRKFYSDSPRWDVWIEPA